MRSTLVKRGEIYSVRYKNEQTSKWTHKSLGTKKRAMALQRYGDFLKDCRKKALFGEFHVQPVPLSQLVSDFLEHMETKRVPKYVQLVRRLSKQWLDYFGPNTLSTAVTVHKIGKYAIRRKQDRCRTKKTPISNTTVNRDLAALKHMFAKAEKWGFVEHSPGRRVDLLPDDSTVRTAYFTPEQLRMLVSTAIANRGGHPLNFNDWPEFIILDANTGLRCQEMLFLEFSDIDWYTGVLHVRNKKHLGWRPKGRKERRIPLNRQAISALRAMFNKKHPDNDLVFHQADGSPWKSILESFRTLLKRCGFKRAGVHILRHTFGAHLAQKGVEMSVIRDLLGHHSVTLTEKYYAHLAPSNLSSAVKRLESREGEKSVVPKTVPNCTKNGIADSENPNDALLLTDSFERCYVPELALLAGVAKLAYAADSKSAGT